MYYSNIIKQKDIKMKKKTVKLTKKALDKCPHCGRPKAKDETVVTPERMQLINEVMSKLDEENIRLA
jgi:MoaA/NifB/PqqE/SkfB family radical SAM enzyme